MAEYIILGVLLIFLIYIFSMFSPAFTQRINENLYVVFCGFVNFYVYKKDNTILLFDAGMNPAAAKRGLKNLGLSPEDVSCIFLTHTDYDHLGGMTAFPKAKVYISKDEEQMVNGKTARRGFMHNRRMKDYITLQDGETVTIGSITVKTAVKPGHTAGSCVYLIDSRYLATGDLLRLTRNGDIKPFIWLMNKNHVQDKKSVSESKELIDNAEYILTGHSGFHKN